MNNVTPEFLEAHGFSKVQFPDGIYWLRYYNRNNFVQANYTLTEFTESDASWIDDLTEQEFIDIIIANEQAIYQYK